MLNEFYNYIANNTLSFFQEKASSIRPGERYCLRLDNEEMVKGVDDALRHVTLVNNIQGTYQYKNVYSTFTICLSIGKEIVVVSKINGMTDDFLATLRNADLTDKHFPVLMITHSTIDTITSGTGDLAAKGMPFHAVSIVSRIQEDIGNAQFSIPDKTLMEMELKRKQSDRYSDKSSLYEYSDLLTVLGRGYVKEEDYHLFSLVSDPDCAFMVDEKKLRARFEENHHFFSMIDQVFKHGNIKDSLSSEFDKSFVDHVQECKKTGKAWYEGYTYNMLKRSQDKLKKKLDNPLNIEDRHFEVFSGTRLEYLFDFDSQVFIRDDGQSKAKSRRKNLLIYNNDNKDEVSVAIHTNIFVKQNCIECIGGTASSSSHEVLIHIKPTGCSFAQAKLTDDNNNITYIIKICVINLMPKYLENIQTSYVLMVPSSAKRQKIQIFGVSDKLIINPGQSVVKEVEAEDEMVYECTHDQTLSLKFEEDTINSDTGYLDCYLKFGTFTVPIRIQDELTKPTELTGVAAFKKKFENRKSFEYRDGNKIVSGTDEYYAREPFRSFLEIEKLFIDNCWLAITDTVEGKKEEKKLNIPSNIHDAYIALVNTFKENRTVPSLAYYKDELLDAARKYASVVEEYVSNIPEGATLSPQDNDVLLLGCVIQSHDEHVLSMSPLQPLNVIYQLKLLEESEVGKVRDDLIGKLSPLYLLPYIKDEGKNLYHAIEQKDSPEWRYYAPISNNRFQGARNFVQKLVQEKIVQYKDHFSFLFDDIGNSEMRINLINMGDCREIFQGLIRYYVQFLKSDISSENYLRFIVNVYSKASIYNEFSLLSDQHKLKEYVGRLYSNQDVDDLNELVIVLSSNIHCFYHSDQDPTYEYAHLAFYEMTSAEDSGASRMDTITTGISLGGITSGTPSVLNGEWYKTGLGTKYAKQNMLTRVAAYYNALFRVAFSGSSYEPNSSIFTEIEQGQEGLLGKIYKSSNWVVFVDPKVDLSFFNQETTSDNDLMIIHYSDQYTSASGYDDITVTQKSEQYNEIIAEQLQKKGVNADKSKIHEIINLFNAVNGGWLLRLITAKKLTGAADSNFSREKMSILSAIKLCMAYYSHPDIIWIPISLEEMLRVSGGAGLSQKDGLLSARNLGFEQKATSDDILLVGIEGPNDDIKIYLHPVEVKIGENKDAVISKAHAQVLNTYQGFWNSLWPVDGRYDLERKLSRNFFIQVILDCCEKMRLYNVYPNEDWETVLSEYRENLLNEKYTFSNKMDSFIGKGTIISFGTDILNKSGKITDDVCLLEFPEKLGSSYMILSAKDIEKELDADSQFIPWRLKIAYQANKNDEQDIPSVEKQQTATTPDNDDAVIGTNTSEPSDELENHASQDSSVNLSVIDNTEAETNSTSVTGMNIVFGKDIISGENLLWKPNDTNQVFHTNTGIIGTMGTGKTQFTKSMITQLYRDQEHNFTGDPLGILIFDYKGDYNESKEDFIKATNAKVVKPYHLPFNPLALTKAKVFKPLLPIHTANAFKDTLAKVYALGPKQQNTLFQCIIEAYAARGIIPGNPSSWDNVPPTFDMVYSIYENNEDIKKIDSLAAVMDKLYQFQIFEGDPHKTVSLYDLLDGVVVIDLSGYDSDIQSLIIAITLDLFYSQMQASGSSKLDNQYRQLTKLILVDEADNFMSEGFPSLKKILKEGREFGVGTILSTQFLKHFGTGDDDYSKYILTWVVHNVADLKPADVEFVFKTESKSVESQNLFNDIKALKKHHSIVKIGNGKPRYIEDKPFWQLYKDLDLD